MLQAFPTRDRLSLSSSKRHYRRATTNLLFRRQLLASRIFRSFPWWQVSRLHLLEPPNLAPRLAISSIRCHQFNHQWNRPRRTLQNWPKDTARRRSRSSLLTMAKGLQRSRLLDRNCQQLLARVAHVQSAHQPHPLSRTRLCHRPQR